MKLSLVDQLLQRTGLLPVLQARAEGCPVSRVELTQLTKASDLLAIGAAADRVRRAECGDVVRIHVPEASPALRNAQPTLSDPTLRGTRLLRHVAFLRLSLPPGTPLLLDWESVGMEMAQVGLNFGATDLTGKLSTRRGLPMAEDESQKQLWKRKEITGFVERAGFMPVFVKAEAPPSHHATVLPGRAEETF